MVHGSWKNEKVGTALVAVLVRVRTGTSPVPTRKQCIGVKLDISIVALIAGVFSIGLAIVAIWQANHHRDQSDRLNRDTTEKLSRIEAFATSTKEDAFKELEKWGDFARAGGKASYEAEKAKEEELRKLKDEIRATTSTEINKVLQTVESKFSSSSQTSTISDIKKEFEELKKQIGKIQDRSLVQIKRLDIEQKFKYVWTKLKTQQKALLIKASDDPHITEEDLAMAGMSGGLRLDNYLKWFIAEGVIDNFLIVTPGLRYQLELSREFREFLQNIKKA